MSDIPERPQTILVTIHESTRSIIERVYLAFAMDDWISKFAIEKNKRIATLEAQLREREQEIERLTKLVTPSEFSRACNHDLSGKFMATDGITIFNRLIRSRITKP